MILAKVSHTEVTRDEPPLSRTVNEEGEAKMLTTTMDGGVLVREGIAGILKNQLWSENKHTHSAH